MSEKELDSGNFNEEINNTEKLVLVDFYATWCGPCKMLAPVVSEIAEEYKEKLEVYKVNIDENQELALKYDIMSIPTLMFFKFCTHTFCVFCFFSSTWTISTSFFQSLFNCIHNFFIFI